MVFDPTSLPHFGFDGFGLRAFGHLPLGDALGDLRALDTIRKRRIQHLTAYLVKLARQTEFPLVLSGFSPGRNQGFGAPFGRQLHHFTSLCIRAEQRVEKVLKSMTFNDSIMFVCRVIYCVWRFNFRNRVASK